MNVARLRELAELAHGGGHTSFPTERGEAVLEETYLALVEDYAELGALALELLDEQEKA